MIKSYGRNLRVAQEIQKEIATVLQHKIKTLNTSMMTVSGVNVSRDLAYAKVYVTFMNDKTPEQAKTDIRALQDMVGFIRSVIGRSMRLRIVPELTFIYDNSLVEGARISNIISQVIQNDISRKINQTSETDSREK